METYPSDCCFMPLSDELHPFMEIMIVISIIVAARLIRLAKFQETKTASTSSLEDAIATFDTSA